jgi:DNA invertase Pin-like site-specific DNA recombinase
VAERSLRVAIYARVSTSDKDQNPETQLLPLREFCTAQGWKIAKQFVDTASATDLRGRTAWRTLLDEASKRRIDVILCWKLDRCFRSPFMPLRLWRSCAVGMSGFVVTRRLGPIAPAPQVS